MVEYVLVLFESVFLNCVNWTGKLLDAVGGKGVVLAAFTIVLVIGLLFIPMRGNGMVNIVSYQKQSMIKKEKAKQLAKRSSGKR